MVFLQTAGQICTTVETYDDNNDFYEINIHLLARKDPIFSMILSAIIEYQQISTRFFSSFQSVAKHLSRLTGAPSNPSNSSEKGGNQRLRLSHNGVSSILFAACVALNPIE